MIKNEDDLWRQFGGQDHTQPGQWRQPFKVVFQTLLDREAYNRYKPAKPSKAEGQKAKRLIKQTPLKDTSRFYLLIGRERQVCVDQSRLIKVGKAMRDPSWRFNTSERLHRRCRCRHFRDGECTHNGIKTIICAFSVGCRCGRSTVSDCEKNQLAPI